MLTLTTNKTNETTLTNLKELSNTRHTPSRPKSEATTKPTMSAENQNTCNKNMEKTKQLMTISIIKLSKNTKERTEHQAKQAPTKSKLNGSKSHATSANIDRLGQVQAAKFSSRKSAVSRPHVEILTAAFDGPPPTV